MQDEIKKYEWKGRVVGFTMLDNNGRRYFKPAINEFEAVDLVREMDPEDRAHMRRRAYGVHRALRHFGHDPEDYIDDNDVQIAIANLGCKNLTSLYRSDRRLWELVKQRGLEKQLFSEECLNTGQNLK